MRSSRANYDESYEKQYGFPCSIVDEVVQEYLKVSAKAAEKINGANFQMKSLQANRKHHLGPFKTLWGGRFSANFDILVLNRVTFSPKYGTCRPTF
jgi:hypothetical protein